MNLSHSHHRIDISTPSEAYKTTSHRSHSPLTTVFSHHHRSIMSASIATTTGAATTRVVPSTLRLKYEAQWRAAEQRWYRKHPQSPPLANPIHDWSDGTCEMMFPDYIDEWMARFPPIGTNIPPKRSIGKRKGIARALRSLGRKFSCM